MIAQEFASLLDGVSYCERLIYPGHYSQSTLAADFASASKEFDNVYLCQCYGTTVDRGTDSYAKESWRLVGRLHLWDTLPLVFDQRDLEREKRQLCFDGVVKPMVLVSMSGRSSPFPHAAGLRQILDQQTDFHICDVSTVRLERFYDMLGLVEKSMALITTDSGLLHLAQAVPNLPVIALVTHSPDSWHGSPRRANHVFYCRYNEFMERRGEIPVLLQRIKSGVKINRLVHVYSDYDHRSDDAEYRFRIAQLSWGREYKSTEWLTVPVHDSTLLRNAISIAEKKPSPFLKDVIGRAAEIAGDDDIIVFTNDDTNFCPDFSVRIRQCLTQHESLWGSRQELASISQAPTQEDMAKGYKHCGADVFAFRKSWWTKYRSRVPDFLLSFECWDLSFRTLIELTGGIEVEGLCAHHIHQPYWHSPQHRECVGNLYNRDLCRRFFSDNSMPWPQT